MAGLKARIEASLSKLTGEFLTIQNSRRSYGGCINDSQIIELSNGDNYFLKTHPNANLYPGMFAAEFKALSLIHQTKTIRVPTPVLYENDFIVMEYFQEGNKDANWYENIGQQLALLHKNSQKDLYGFDEDNYLGTTKQRNSWKNNWCEFWAENRLGYQLELFSQKTSHDDDLLKAGYDVLDKLDEVLSSVTEPAVLLHGDLWSGNAAADEKGQPVIFDPASYYGHREAEIGMMRMFGGFGPRVEAAYGEVWPLEPDSERRITLYRLYHELNHLNLFGQSYYSACYSSINSLL